MVPLSVILLTPVPVSVQVPLAIVVVPLQVEAAVIALVGVAPRCAVQPEARLNALPWSLVMTTLLKGEPVQVKVVVWPLSVSVKVTSLPLGQVPVAIFKSLPKDMAVPLS